MSTQDQLKKLYQKGLKIDDSLTGRVDKVLSKLISGWSRSLASRLIKTGSVKINGDIIKKGSKTISVGDLLWVDEDTVSRLDKEAEEGLKLREFGITGDKSVIKPEDIPLDIVYEDSDVLVVDKPAGMVIHPAYANKSGTLINAVAGYFDKKGISYPSRIGLVHRLDKDVSGLVLIAKNDKALRTLSKQFNSEGIENEESDISHKVRKYYWAVVGPTTETELKRSKIVSEDTLKIEGYIRRSPKNRKIFEFHKNEDFLEGPGGRYSLSYARLLCELGNGLFLLEIRIITGRTHQIRTSLANIGFPVVGDRVYSGKTLNSDDGVKLRCVRLEYIPSGVYNSIDNMANQLCKNKTVLKDIWYSGNKEVQKMYKKTIKSVKVGDGIGVSTSSMRKNTFVKALSLRNIIFAPEVP